MISQKDVVVIRPALKMALSDAALDKVAHRHSAIRYWSDLLGCSCIASVLIGGGPILRDQLTCFPGYLLFLMFPLEMGPSVVVCCVACEVTALMNNPMKRKKEPPRRSSGNADKITDSK